MQIHNPPHPGAMIKRIVSSIEPKITIGQFADHIGVSRSALTRVLNGHAGVTPDMSIRIAQAFGTPTTGIWFSLQSDYDLWQAMQVKRKVVKPLHKVAA